MNKPTFTLTSTALPDISGEKEMAVEFECIVVNCTGPRLVTLVWVDSQFTPEQAVRFEETGEYDEDVFIQEDSGEPWLYTGWATRPYPDEDFYEGLTESADFVVMAWRPVPRLTPEFMLGIACEEYSKEVKSALAYAYNATEEHVKLAEDIGNQAAILTLCNAVSTSMRMKKLGMSIDVAKAEAVVAKLRGEVK